MKRKLIIVLCGLFLCFNFAFTEQQNIQGQDDIEQAWSGTNSGDYVIYRDYSWKSKTWIGFLYYDKNTVGSFLYTDDGKTFVKILFSGEVLDGEFVITGQNNISGRNNSPNYIYAVNYLMQMLPKFYQWREKPKSDSLVVKKSSKNIFEGQYGGECLINFSSYIPLFYINSIIDKDQKNILKLEEMGLAKDDKDFFEFSPIKTPKKEKTSFVLNKNAKKTPKLINNIKLNIDEQWRQDTENSFFLNGSAFFAVLPIDLSNVSGIKNNDINFIIKYLCVSSKDVKVLLDKTDIIGSKERFKIIGPAYNRADNIMKTSIRLVIKHGDFKYTIIPLSVNTDLYEKNKEYFNNLFE